MAMVQSTLRRIDHLSGDLHLEGEGLVKDTGTPGVEGTGEGEEGGNLADGLADKDQPETDQGVGEH